MKSRNYEPAEGALSVKTVLAGRATWYTREGRFEVTPDTCVILNEAQNYGLESGPAHTFCVFFMPAIIRQAVASLGLRGDVGFYQRLRILTPGLIGSMNRIRQVMADGQSETVEGEEALIDVLIELLAFEDGPTQRDSLDYVKASVREEVFQRLNLARDYALTNLSSRVTLDDLAAVACMSPFHFHRMHRQAFRQTPHEFLTEARLQRAMRLLRSGRTVEDVAADLGFESSPSFWRRFRALTGQTPGSFRKIG